MGGNFNLMAKPSGPLCNLDCEYCFYLEKEALFSDEKSHRYHMSDGVQEQYVKQYIESQEGDVINFAFQGGEPTLVGLRYFERLIELANKYCPRGKRLTYSLQTNGTTLNDKWGEFLKKHNWLVGISIDGPEKIHDKYRHNKRGGGSFSKVIDGLGVLKKYKIEFNTLTVINGYNWDKGAEVYTFLREIGSNCMQFIPIVEREMSPGKLAPAPDLDKVEEKYSIPSWAITPHGFGSFYKDVYDAWIAQDVGRVFVQLFDVILGQYLGHPSSLCVYAETCGDAGIIEHTGEVYSCDHFVYPDYYLGDIKDSRLRDLFASNKQVHFGNNKRDKLPRYCKKCKYLQLCNGACPKHRFAVTPHGDPGLNYLCEGLRMIYGHTEETMRYMHYLHQNRKPPSEVMDWVRAGKPAPVISSMQMTAPSRRSPCPCGSGKKYKHCHGKES